MIVIDQYDWTYCWSYNIFFYCKKYLFLVQLTLWPSIASLESFQYSLEQNMDKDHFHVSPSRGGCNLKINEYQQSYHWQLSSMSYLFILWIWHVSEEKVGEKTPLQCRKTVWKKKTQKDESVSVFQSLTLKIIILAVRLCLFLCVRHICFNLTRTLCLRFARLFVWS